MKSIFTLIILIVSAVSSFGQIYDQWFDGTIRLNDGKIINRSINLYNFENDDVHFRYKGQESRLLIKNFTWLRLNDTVLDKKRRFYVLPNFDYGFSKYEVLVEDNHITLLCREVQRRHADIYVNDQTLQSGQKRSKLNNYSRFYLIIDGGDIQGFSKDKETNKNMWAFNKIDPKKLYGIIGKDLIKNYVKTEDLTLSDKNDVTQLIEFCNSQIKENGH